MSYKIINQTPIALTSDYNANANLKHIGDPIKELSQNISDKLFTNANTKIIYNKIQLTTNEITNLLVNCTGEKIDPYSEHLAHELLSQTVLDYSFQKELPIRLMYAQMAGERAKLPAPTHTLIYTVNNDVIPSCKGYLANQTDSDTVFASLAYTFKPQVLSFGFKNEQEFTEFQTYFHDYFVKPLLGNGLLSSDTIAKCKDFAHETLHTLTDSLRLRYDNDEEQEPYAFARILVFALYQFVSLNTNQAFAMPFDLGENYNPKGLVLANIDYHAHATIHEINTCWHEINNAMHHPVRTLSSKQLKHLQSVQRVKRFISQKINTQEHDPNVAKARYMPLSATQPSQKLLLKRVLLIMNKIKDVNQSDNVYKTAKRTFNRPNRRHPNNPDLAGKIISTQYKPDLHVYLDTSGSITQDNYAAGIKLCILLAKKLDVNLYFNSFSDELSPCYKLPLKGRSVSEIYAYFELINKVTGGTDFSNVWAYINAAPKRQRELSLLITDFGDYAPSYSFKHPKNLYYLPIDQSDYSEIKDQATDFLESMIHSGHNIRNQILL